MDDDPAVEPPEAVWAVWTAVEGSPTWDTGLTEARIGEPLGLGARGELVSEGRTSRFVITAWDPSRACTFETRLPLGALVVSRSLTPAPSGSLTLTHAVQFRGFGGALLAPRLGPRFRAVVARVASLAQAASAQVEPASLEGR